MVAAPSSRDVRRAVMGKLGLHGNMTNAQLGGRMTWSFGFEPSVAIAAGRIDKLGLDIRSFREPLARAVRQVMTKSIKQNFEESGRPPWEPWAEATVFVRGQMGWSGGDVLILTGALRAAASQQNIWTIGPNSAVVRDLPERVWYGRIHQAGYDGGSMSSRVKKMGAKAALESLMDEQVNAMRTGTKIKAKGAAAIPQRRFIMFQPEDEDDIMEIFLEWLGERVRRAWPPIGGF